MWPIAKYVTPTRVLRVYEHMLRKRPYTGESERHRRCPILSKDLFSSSTRLLEEIDMYIIIIYMLY